MKKTILLIFLFCVIYTNTRAQSWVQVPGYQIYYGPVSGVTKYQGDLWVKTTTGIYRVSGSTWTITSTGFVVTNGIGCMYTDGIDLYAGGLFNFGSYQALVLKWNGLSWDPIGFTDNTASGVFVSTILKTSYGLYIGGFFNTIGAIPTSLNNFGFWAFFDSASWEQLFSIVVPGCGSGVWDIKDIGDSIYVAGGFSEIGGVSTPGTFRFKENGGMSTLDNYGFCFLAKDYQIYQGYLYAGGTRRSDNILVDLGLSKRVGNTWTSTVDEIQITETRLAVLLGKLYIAGRATGAPISGSVPIVVSYDGTSVINEGAGISTPPNPFSYFPEATGIFADTVDNKLYIYGNFNTAKGDVADYFAVKTFSIVPINLSSFTAKLSSRNKIDLNWVDQTPSNQNSFEIQMSKDGVNFFKVGTVKGNDYQNHYSFPYQLSGCGNYYFRLHYENKYSEIRPIDLPCDGPKIVAGKQSILIDTKVPGTLTIISPSGQKIQARTVLAYETFPLSVSPGIYIVLFIDKDGNRSTQKVFIQ